MFRKTVSAHTTALRPNRLDTGQPLLPFQLICRVIIIGRISDSTITETCSFDLNHALALPLEIPHLLQDCRAGKEILGQPLSPDNTFLINNEEPPSRNQSTCLLIRLSAGVIPDDLHLRMIAQKRVRKLERIGKCLLGEGVVCADPEDLNVQLLEFPIVDLPGRQVLRSRRTKIVDVKLKENVLLSPKLAQADLFSGRT